VPKGHKGPLELVCKATDESYNTQVGARGGWSDCSCIARCICVGFSVVWVCQQLSSERLQRAGKGWLCFVAASALRHDYPLTAPQPF